MIHRETHPVALALRYRVPFALLVFCGSLMYVWVSLRQGTAVPGLVGPLPDSLTVVDARHCTKCALAAVPIATLGSGGDGELVRSSEVVVARNSLGSYFVASTGEIDPRVYVFDSGGRFLRTIGRRGSGPGELSYIMDIRVGVGDSLLVAGEKLISIFDPSGRYIRQLRATSDSLGVMVTQLIDHRPSGDVIVMGLGGSVAGIARPFVVVSDRGALRSFGPHSVWDHARLGLSHSASRLVGGQGPDGTYWVLDRGYLLSGTDSTGAFRSHLGGISPAWERRVWSEEAADSVSALPAPPSDQHFWYRPAPMFRGVRGTAEGWVVVAYQKPVDNWQDFASVWRSRSSKSPTGAQQDSLYSTVVDLIDPHTGALIDQTVLPNRWSFVNGLPLLFHGATTDSGVVQVSIRSLQLSHSTIH
jgi:hypothetical protein